MTVALPERLRLRYHKVGRVRFVSQRDLARVIERALRRAGLPLLKTKGFTPRPQLSFGLALPTGCASTAEFVDLRLDPDGAEGIEVVEPTAVDPGTLADLAVQLSSLLPEGVDVVAAGALDGPECSLQELVGSCDWIVEVLGVSPAGLAGRVERLLSADEVPVSRTRKGRRSTDDLRPQVRSLGAMAPEGGTATARLSARLGTKPRGVRPGELCEALGADVRLLGALRTHQWIEDERMTAICEPLSESGIVGGRPPGAEAPGG